MPPVVASLVSVFLVLALGWALRAGKVLGESAWSGFERVTYLVLFPAVIVQTLAMAELGRLPFLAIGVALVGAILLVSALLLALRSPLARIGVDGPAFTSILQGAIRWNTFVALAIAGSLHGGLGVALMAIAIAAMVPLLNLISVAALSRFAHARPMSARELALAVARNPFVWASALGLALNPLAHLAPLPLLAGVDILARASLAGGLLVVGAGLDLHRLKRPKPAHALAVGLKLLLMPLLAWAIARGLGVGGASLQLVVVASAVPTATASYIMARQLGGDAPLMAEITTIQTLLALLTIPSMLALLT
jgi:predicted permease